MESSISDRIEAEIRRSQIHSPDDEERARLERWLTSGAPMPGTPAERFSDNTPSALGAAAIFQ